ncbi:Arsenical resistance operon repressor [Corynebacterium aurimucosum]|nr:Arsenical resistance operon repressor [Corynebacterium aurimucosum]
MQCTARIDMRQYNVGRRNNPYTDRMASSSTPETSARGTECCSLSTGPLNDAEARHFSQQFKVLADPARLRLLSILCDEGCGPMSVTELTELTALSQPTVSHHLARLREAGLLSRQQRGRTVTHQVHKDAFMALRTLLSFD